MKMVKLKDKMVENYIALFTQAHHLLGGEIGNVSLGQTEARKKLHPYQYSPTTVDFKAAVGRLEKITQFCVYSKQNPIVTDFSVVESAGIQTTSYPGSRIISCFQFSVTFFPEELELYFRAPCRKEFSRKFFGLWKNEIPAQTVSEGLWVCDGEDSYYLPIEKAVKKLFVQYRRGDTNSQVDYFLELADKVRTFNEISRKREKDLVSRL
jgi:hypothetical protein